MEISLTGFRVLVCRTKTEQGRGDRAIFQALN